MFVHSQAARGEVGWAGHGWTYKGLQGEADPPWDNVPLWGRLGRLQVAMGLYEPCLNAEDNKE